jgi:hypothetical protein
MPASISTGTPPRRCARRLGWRWLRRWMCWAIPPQSMPKDGPHARWWNARAKGSPRLRRPRRTAATSSSRPAPPRARGARTSRSRSHLGSDRARLRACLDRPHDAAGRSDDGRVQAARSGAIVLQIGERRDRESCRNFLLVSPSPTQPRPLARLTLPSTCSGAAAAAMSAHKLGGPAGRWRADPAPRLRKSRRPPGRRPGERAAAPAPRTSSASPVSLPRRMPLMADLDRGVWDEVAELRNILEMALEAGAIPLLNWSGKGRAGCRTRAPSSCPDAGERRRSCRWTSLASRYPRDRPARVARYGRAGCCDRNGTSTEPDGRLRQCSDFHRTGRTRREDDASPSPRRGRGNRRRRVERAA